MIAVPVVVIVSVMVSYIVSVPVVVIVSVVVSFSDGSTCGSNSVSSGIIQWCQYLWK